MNDSEKLDHLISLNLIYLESANASKYLKSHLLNLDKDFRFDEIKSINDWNRGLILFNDDHNLTVMRLDDLVKSRVIKFNPNISIRSVIKIEDYMNEKRLTLQIERDMILKTITINDFTHFFHIKCESNSFMNFYLVLMR